MLRDLLTEIDRLEGIALYLADCHAATSEYDGTLKSVSKSRSRRLREICLKASDMLTQRVPPPRRSSNYANTVLERLLEASLKGQPEGK